MKDLIFTGKTDFDEKIEFITKNFIRTKCIAKWILKCLSTAQKRTRIETSGSMEEDQDFSNHHVTTDETSIQKQNSNRWSENIIIV